MPESTPDSAQDEETFDSLTDDQDISADDDDSVGINPRELDFIPYHMDQDKDELQSGAYIEIPYDSEDSNAIEHDIDLDELDTAYVPSGREYGASTQSPSSSSSDIEILPSAFFVFFFCFFFFSFFCFSLLIYRICQSFQYIYQPITQ